MIVQWGSRQLTANKD